MATRKFECPFCKYRFLADPVRMQMGGEVLVVRKTSDRANLADDRTIDLTCPNCRNDFEVRVKA